MTLFASKTSALCLAALLLVCGSASVATVANASGPRDAPPKEVENVGIDEHIGAKVPVELPFVDSTGLATSLRAILAHGNPVLLTLNYSNCPMLCSVQLNGFVEALKKMEWSVGKEFEIVTVSLDPKEAPTKSAQTKTRYVESYGRATAQTGWHFFTGDEINIRALAAAVGFRYNYVPDTGDYSHAPAVIVLTPDGTISRYLFGVMYEPKTVRLSLVEAAAGRLGSPLDKIILYCFHYDAEKGRYAPVARKVMQLGGAVMVLLVGFLLGGVWIRERKQRKA